MSQTQIQANAMSDTIYALATAQGRSAVQIMRISGGRAKTLLTQLTGRDIPPRIASFAELRLDDALMNGAVIDQALVLFFEGPASATGEDTAELHLHGSPVLSQILLDWLALQPSTRIADRGEFTRRGFLNGKINLD